MGNHRQALHLIVTQLQDVKYAIDFCKEHNYESLWNELIDYSLEKPSKLSLLHKFTVGMFRNCLLSHLFAWREYNSNLLSWNLHILFAQKQDFPLVEISVL